MSVAVLWISEYEGHLVISQGWKVQRGDVSSQGHTELGPEPKDTFLEGTALLSLAWGSIQVVRVS